MRHACWMRRLISSKSNTYTESMNVDAADISMKVGAHYPGRSHLVSHEQLIAVRR
jgi:hypothetical protein